MQAEQLPSNVAFCSGGKDSVAQLIIAKEHNEPMDAVAFCEVMFDKKTSGEHPLHRDFVYQKLQPFVIESLKIPFIVLHSPKTYVDYFNHIISRGKAKGKVAGFPIPGMCAINRDCKLKAINNFRKSHNIGCEYVGIAADEPERLARLEGTNRKSLLAKYNCTEAQARSICAEHGLLSPVYEIGKRNGCWFCMNCSDNEFVWLIKNRPDLFDKLIALESSQDDLYRSCLTRTETPTQIKERLYCLTAQMCLF